MNDLSYNQLLDDIFTAYTERKGIHLYGEDYDKTLENLREHLSKDAYFDLEDRLNSATFGIAFNAFCAGFRHAIIMLMGDVGALFGTGGEKDE